MGLDQAAKDQLEANIRTAAASYIGQTLDEAQQNAARDIAVDAIRALQAIGDIPMNVLWCVLVSPEGVITYRWMNNFDELIVQ
jgi:hypothetical protein